MYCSLHNHDPFHGLPMSSFLATRRKLKSRKSSLSSSLSKTAVIFFYYFVQKRAMNYDVTLNEVCNITTMSGKKDKPREYSLSSSTALLVVCRHANDGGGGEESTL